MTAFWLLLALAVKHFICDFPLQVPYMYLNKGTYGHFGGILHALIHVLGTFLAVLLFFSWPMAWAAGMIDGLIHYHIDWAKMNINKHFELGPQTSEWFWLALGADQLLHYLTYFLIVGALILL